MTAPWSRWTPHVDHCERHKTHPEPDEPCWACDREAQEAKACVHPLVQWACTKCVPRSNERESLVRLLRSEIHHWSEPGRLTDSERAAVVGVLQALTTMVQRGEHMVPTEQRSSEASLAEIALPGLKAATAAIEDVHRRLDGAGVPRSNEAVLETADGRCNAQRTVACQKSAGHSDMHNADVAWSCSANPPHDGWDPVGGRPINPDMSRGPWNDAEPGRCTARGNYNMCTSQCTLLAGHEGPHDGGSYVGKFGEAQATYPRPETALPSRPDIDAEIERMAERARGVGTARDARLRRETIEACMRVCLRLSDEYERARAEASADGHSLLAQACIERGQALREAAHRIPGLVTVDEKTGGGGT